MNNSLAGTRKCTFLPQLCLSHLLSRGRKRWEMQSNLGHEWCLYVVSRRRWGRKGIKSFLPFESRPILPLFVVCYNIISMVGRSVIIYTFLCGNINGHINYLRGRARSPLYSTNERTTPLPIFPDSPVHSFFGTIPCGLSADEPQLEHNNHWQARPNWCPVHVRRGWCLRGGVYEVGGYSPE